MMIGRKFRVTSCALRVKSRTSLLATRNSQLATSSRGFTLVELLVVIGIILILIGLFFAGAKIVTAQAKERDTRTALETCKTMFANYQQATHLSRLPPGIATYVGSPWAIAPGYSWTTSQEPVPTGVLTPNPPTNVQIVMDTALVMYAIEAIPDNQKIINNLPASKVTNVSILIQGSPGAGPGSPPLNVSVPLILDGYGNPIMFVPGGGLGISSPPSAGPTSLVWLDGANAGIITSTGPITTSSNPYILTKYTPATLTLANQPFFVSAGPDGSLDNSHPNPTNPSDTSASTDDNIYSFKN
jgi:prepilin-type N-terminal cleavage/methylation domain-containing protein